VIFLSALHCKFKKFPFLQKTSDFMVIPWINWPEDFPGSWFSGCFWNFHPEVPFPVFLFLSCLLGFFSLQPKGLFQVSRKVRVPASNSFLYQTFLMKKSDVEMIGAR
jgi:hypothetical protein